MKPIGGNIFRAGTNINLGVHGPDIDYFYFKGGFDSVVITNTNFSKNTIQSDSAVYTLQVPQNFDNRVYQIYGVSNNGIRSNMRLIRVYNYPLDSVALEGWGSYSPSLSLDPNVDSIVLIQLLLDESVYLNTKGKIRLFGDTSFIVQNKLDKLDQFEEVVDLVGDNNPLLGVLKADGTFVIVGYIQNNQRNLNGLNYLPDSISKTGNVVEIACGLGSDYNFDEQQTILVLKNDGTVGFWGLNIPVPNELSQVSNNPVVSISSTWDYKTVLRKDSSIVSWIGDLNYFTPARPQYQSLNGLSGVSSIASGEGAQYALKNDSIYFAKSISNYYTGFLDPNYNNPKLDKSLLTPYPVANNIKKIKSGVNFVDYLIGLTTDSHLYFWPYEPSKTIVPNQNYIKPLPSFLSKDR